MQIPILVLYPVVNTITYQQRNINISLSQARKLPFQIKGTMYGTECSVQIKGTMYSTECSVQIEMKYIVKCTVYSLCGIPVECVDCYSDTPYGN